MAASVAGLAAAWWAAPAATEDRSQFPAHYPVHGVDVSHHNGSVDWSQVARSGIAFAWLKASEGGDVRDSRFRSHAAEAHAAGVRVGAYHFFTFCRAGADQAENFLAVVGETPLALPPAVDVEFVGNCRKPPSPAQIRRELETWLSLVEPKLGRAVVYTTPDADEALLDGLERARWIRSISAEPRGGWRFWQFEPSGHVPGIDGPVDLDVFAGPLEALGASAAEGAR